MQSKVVGVEEDRASAQTVDDAFRGMLDRYRLGGSDPRAESPAVSFLARSLSAAQSPSVFTPDLLHDAAIDYATQQHGFVSLIEVDSTGNIELVRASHVEVTGSYLNPVYNLTLRGTGDQNVRVDGVTADQIYQVRYSQRGSVFDVHPELARAEARLLRAIGDEVGGPTGQVLALGIREGGKDGATRKRGPVSDELSQLRGGLATFVAAESGAGGEPGSSVFQPRPWHFTRLGASPPEALVGLSEQINQMVASSLGVPYNLLLGGAQTGLRESLRVFISTTLLPLARRFQYEAQEKLGLDDEWRFPDLVASDIATRARAFKALVDGGLKPDEARRIAGLEE